MELTWYVSGCCTHGNKATADENNKRYNQQSRDYNWKKAVAHGDLNMELFHLCIVGACVEPFCSCCASTIANQVKPVTSRLPVVGHIQGACA